MKGDFSRDTFDATKHFSRVLMQQGRVQLDADWNEQTSILLHYLRTLAQDILGPAAAVGDGFQITVNDNQITIGEGRMYVDGILCENDDKDLLFTKQKNYPGAKMPENPILNSKYLVYLDAWERHITALEDDSIREKALGGADTATRTEVVWQVKISEESISDCSKAEAFFEKQRQKGKLKVEIDQVKPANTPCVISPESKYRGLENHLYRVEIHKGSNTQSPTFKWSRDNGSVVTSCKIQGSTVEVNNPNGFSVGDWVELISNAQELREEPGVLVQVDAIDNDLLIFKEISPPDGLPDNEKGSWPDKVRRWESDAISVVANEKMIKLEHGIQIQFSGSSYTTGDYWLIPARVADGAIEWDNDNNGDGVEPHGVTHHYAPLAILTYPNGSWTVGTPDCRKTMALR